MVNVNPNKMRIEAWSSSRYNDWVKCPRFAFYKHVMKMKEPGNAAMDRGSAIHKTLEKYINGDDPKAKPPVELHKNLVPDYMAMRDEGYICESELAFNNKWHITSWFGQAAWCRIKVDAISEDCSVIIDHKTGQQRDGYDAQLELYALGADLISEVKHDKITTALLFVDHGTKEVKVYPRDELDKLAVKWEKRVKPMLEDVAFVPCPGNACRWCFYRKSNNGPCEF